MRWLNYHHFFYFWTVAREGSVARAARVLRLTEPTVSSQLHDLEASLGEKLFRREGRGLALTDAGRLAQRYANHIFTLGQEFQAAIEGVGVSKAARFTVGIARSVPRLLAARALEPALRSSKSFILACESDSPERLLVDLVTHRLDAVVSDAPFEKGGGGGTHARLLEESGVTFFGTKELCTKLRRRFPKSIDGAPFLLPTEDSVLRRSLDRWFLMTGVRPELRAELGDGALLETLGAAGAGVFVAATSIEKEVRREYRVGVVARVPAIRQRLYVISASRKAEHPAVALLLPPARAAQR